MVQINFAKREVQCKVVYYGPAHSGKTANLRAVHNRVPPQVRGSLTTIATDAQRTLYFDFLPLNVGDVAGIRTKVHLYSVPYIDHQNALRVLVLEGVDGIVFVADRTPGRMEDNMEALQNLEENLAQLGRELGDVPIVFQWNKSDVDDPLSVEELESKLNPYGHPSCSAAADTGKNVLAALKYVTQGVLVDVSKVMAMHPGMSAPAAEKAQPAAAEEASPRPEAVREPVYTPPWRRGHVPEETATSSRRLSAVGPVAEDTSTKPFPTEPRKKKSALDFELPEPEPRVKTETRPTPPARIEEAVPEPEPPLRPAAAETPPKREPVPAPEPEPVQGLVAVGGRPPAYGQSGWNAPVAKEAAERPRPARTRGTPVLEPIRPASAASFAYGALFAIVSLAAIGYLVHYYL